MADEDHASAFWMSVANAFKGDLGIVFDLYNEPFPDQGTSTGSGSGSERSGSGSGSGGGGEGGIGDGGPACGSRRSGGHRSHEQLSARFLTSSRGRWLRLAYGDGTSTACITPMASASGAGATGILSATVYGAGIGFNQPAGGLGATSPARPPLTRPAPESSNKEQPPARCSSRLLGTSSARRAPNTSGPPATSGTVSWVVFNSKRWDDSGTFLDGPSAQRDPHGVPGSFSVAAAHPFRVLHRLRSPSPRTIQNLRRRQCLHVQRRKLRAASDGPPAAQR